MLLTNNQTTLMQAVAHDLGQSATIDAQKPIKPANPMTHSIITDSNAIRVMAHLVIVFKYLDAHYAEGALEQFKRQEVILQAHVEHLEQVKKSEAIPTYISLMTEERGSSTLGQLLLSVTDLDDQKVLLRLMEEYELNVGSILHHQYRTALLRSSLMQKKSRWFHNPKLEGGS
jgi:5'-deoxynucleotidase YfbR-like HD superfamily hydrolase